MMPSFPPILTADDYSQAPAAVAMAARPAGKFGDVPAPQPAKTGAFGERMKREREMRGVKLEEIAESTKIGKRNLVALEQEQFDQLPGGIFNKGFVRAYAKYLGLHEEQAVNEFMAASAHFDTSVEIRAS